VADSDVPALSIGSSCVGDVLVLAVSGDIDTLTAPLLVEALEHAVTENPAALVIDLTEVHFLATPGMTALVQAEQKATGASVRMAVVADGPTTSRPLKMMGLDRTLGLQPSLADALARFADPAVG
jgi:anti-sigma B factor antagonist